MRKYDKENICKKCGEIGATSEYSDGWPEPKFLNIFGGPPDDFEPQEVIKRVCNNCKYIWLDEPMP